ncbi:RNA polymerase sigma factor YlaC [Oxobacter pfennigii]|uniref:RNA polymerase sigma factor YlaC n=2 Tax=Oxobacter pfennigii TaxID=36849 RepID=A0A0P8W5P3_9CLOT|nr:RNA polymerase sigma factor YlaC [Oxobacter pfennigii]
MLLFLTMIDGTEERNKLERLYIKYHKYMFYIANEILNNPNEAQDAVQSSIIKVVNYLDKIDDIECNKTKYLIVTIIKSTSIDMLRRRSKIEYLSLDLTDEYIDINTPNTEDIVIRLSETKELLEKLTEIKAEYADILTLKYYHELSDREIADILSISHENVRTRLSRARAALKKIMIEDRSK